MVEEVHHHGSQSDRRACAGSRPCMNPIVKSEMLDNAEIAIIATPLEQCSVVCDDSGVIVC